MNFAKTFHVGVLVLDDSNMLALAAAVDPLRAANRQADARLYDWHFLSAHGRPVDLTSGIRIEARGLDAAPPLDGLIVMGSFGVAAQAQPPVLARLRRMAPGLSLIAGVDGGSWLLARAGLLDGQTATTHWEDLDDFAAAFPRVRVVGDRFAVSGRVWTTGGAAPCLDMMLQLLRQRDGEALARRVASAFVHDPVLPPAAPQRRVATEALRRRDPRIAEAVARMEESLDAPPGTAALARAAGLSRRSFETRFRAALGSPPGAFLLTLRLEEARRLAIDTALSVQDIALRTGFGSQASLARAFRAGFGQTVSGLRRLHR